MKDVSKKNSSKRYNPNVGFIGNVEVKVANYLFSAKKARKAYQHAEPVAQRILEKEVVEHFQESRKLTKFLKARDLTFSKKTAKGYRTFTVPCTTTVVPLQKSLFNEVEQASQRLIIAMRKVLQDIYGAQDLESSSFVQSLPPKVKETFIKAIKSSACYYPQLHHKNMKQYPFFDNVGLDLVLVEDYLQKSDSFPKLIARNKEEELPGLPFRILELNAGSPSGASNNMNMLQGIYNQNPEILDSLGNVMPNDHFKILGETYKSLGETWTGRTDGIQIILPPGGSNGAAPEIHQLAAYSGLVYADADQLYQDSKGYIRLRTVCKENPVVTAIYSRVNSDSALFDPEKDLILRDPDSGEAIYLTDSLRKGANGKGEVVKDANGNPVPLESSYKIPGAINAIVKRKLYMGGLNRILDNKLILATLTHYGPKYFADAIAKRGLDPKGTKILPPQTLPPTAESAEIIANNPDDWVVKSPNLAGGEGIYILKTLPPAQRREVIKMIKKRPEEFAYQQLVKIGRIPVAVQRKADGHRFANLAADIRIWVFFGGGEDALPRMSHNALVRYAPQERGKMSSIVNTSAGGGYAPFVIVDDTNDKNSVSAKDLVKSEEPKPLTCDIPVFVGAQIVQISRMLKEANTLLNKEETSARELTGLLESMKSQLKEILSFLHPRSIEYIYKATDLLEAKLSKREIEAGLKVINRNQTEITRLSRLIEDKKYFAGIRDLMDNLRVLDMDKAYGKYSEEERALDLVLIDEIKQYGLSNTKAATEERKTIEALVKRLRKSATQEFPNALLGVKSKETIRGLLENFCQTAKARLKKADRSNEFLNLLSLEADVTKLNYETLYLGKRDGDKEVKVASQYEMRNEQNLVESELVDSELKAARKDWIAISDQAQKLSKKKRELFLAQKRTEHFKKYPRLARYQELINTPNLSIDSLIELLPTAPYAKFNIENFAKEQGVSLREVFTNEYRPDRISILETSKLKELKLCSREFAGECFAKKRKSHGLLSNSDIYIWMRKELNPFTLLYTAGHELIHYQQIKNSMEAEKRAVKDGGVSLAKFLNYYGNFLGANNRSVDKLQFDLQAERKPLYGYVDRMHSNKEAPIIKELRAALRSGDAQWENKLHHYGSLFGYMTPNSPSTRVKALQEVLPALENAKNILFATELGLIVNTDPVQAAMPAANMNQVSQYSELITEACKQPGAHWEALRIIASHQYHGISFTRADNEADNLTLRPPVGTVAMGASYNQTQQ
ncbi:MAG: hypothetical protein KC478_07730 [Bacteriovoracaceae bacterium]|nr:hypothetical protein [Bacteriovoracaceae bacterium]